MIQSIKDILISWNATYGERAKMQHAYIGLAIIGVIVAGLVGLVDDTLSEWLVNISVAAIGVFIANVLLWAILYSLVITKLPARRPPNRK